MSFIIGDFNNKKIKFLIDTGTSYNIVSKYNLSSDTMGKMEILPPSVEPTLTNKSIFGKIDMMCTWQRFGKEKKHPFPLTFYVWDLRINILGRDFIEIIPKETKV